MLANKNKFFASLLLMAVVIPTAIFFYQPPIAKADAGSDFLGFMGCKDTNKNGLNFGDCFTGGGSSAGTVTDFTNFQGTLAVPNSAGYSAGITQATDARSYIRNVVNFALGFLGLIAVLVVIYGGVMTVTSVGDPGKADKGKKAITYAATGLLIVMGSFALVNTILLAPSNNESGTSKTAINSSSIRGVAGNARFNYLAQQIETIANNVYNSYLFYYSAKQSIASAQSNILAFNESACVIPLGSCINQFNNVVAGQVAILSNLGSDPSANATFNIGLTAFLQNLEINKSKSLNAVAASISASNCNQVAGTSLGQDVCAAGEVTDIVGQISAAKAAVGTDMAIGDKTAFIAAGFQTTINTAAFQTAKVYQSVFGLASDQIGYKYFQNLLPEFVTTGVKTNNVDNYVLESNSTGNYGATNTEIGNYFKSGTSDITKLQTDVKDILQNLMEIRSLLLNLKFVDAIISADVQQGNAPVIVNFSSVGSTDPSGFGITDDRIAWDLTGDGHFSDGTGEPAKDLTGFMNCDEKNGAVASCIFTKPGTYRVTLKIKATSGHIDPATGLDWSQEIAPGISYIDILVNPPSTKINLTIKAAGVSPQPVITYDPNTHAIQTDADKIYFLLSQAKSGLTFDAAQSTFSDGKTKIDPTSKIRWNFGVNSTNNDTYMIPSAKSLTIDQSYAQTGNYQVNFEVTDKNNIVDRKIFTLVVSNIAPVISNPPRTGSIGSELTFDGSESTSDSGPIQFNWLVEKDSTGLTVAFVKPALDWMFKTAYALTLNSGFSSLPVITSYVEPVLAAQPMDSTKRTSENDFYSCNMPIGKDDTLKCTFKKAGKYKITLSLDDNGTPREVSSEVTISSTAPSAGFKTVKLSDAAPAVYKLDASTLSFDPDEKDNSTMEYSWEISPSTCNLIGFADITPQADLINSSTDAFSTQTPCSQLKDFHPATSQPVVKFTQKGTYTINLVVRTRDEPLLVSDPAEQSLDITNILDISWGNMKSSAILKVPGSAVATPDQLPVDINQPPQAPITFIFNSSQAISYDIDFGDGLTDSGDMAKGASKQVIHNYTKAGKFTAKLSVFDVDDVENDISRKVFIGNSDRPIAIVTTRINGSEIEPQDLTLDDGTKLDNVIITNRKDIVIFDAEKSLNTDGTARRLQYSWNINDNEKQSTNKQVSYNFTQLSDKNTPFVVKLKATNTQDPTQFGEDSVNILVIGEQPTLRSLIAIPQDSNLTTPVTVKLTALGAEDPDGQIVQYKWWYYDASRPVTPDERLGLQITTIPTASLAIGTRGLEGEKPKYAFGLEMTDNDNIIVSTDSQNDATKLNIIPPTIQVTNGPNKAPVARFTVDRTSVNVGDTVNFTSSSFDPDAGGGITEYKWDFGDGTKGDNKPSVSHIYQKASVDGYKVKLTVVDNNFSEATSDVIRVFVDAQAEPPVPGFTVKQVPGTKTVNFTDTSTADTNAGAKISTWSWDFDINTDANGDGIADNDIQSGDQNPTSTYSDFGIYRAKLTIEDNQGQTRSVINFVNVKPSNVAPTPVTPGLTPTNTNNSQPQSGGSSPAGKTLGANLFEAGDRVDTWLLLVSFSAYVILLLAAKSKNKKINQK